MMPAPRTSTYEPKKIYFSAKEAMKILDCPRHWLGYWTVKLGIRSRDGAGWHRYNVKEINTLMEVRKRFKNGSLRMFIKLIGFKIKDKGNG